MMRPRQAALGTAVVLLALFALHDNLVSHSGTSTPFSPNVTVHLQGVLAGWNSTNPTITVNQGDAVSVILTSGDITHQFAVDLDNDTTNPTGSCPTGDACSSQFGIGPATTLNFTAPTVPGVYGYFCTFHFEMVGKLVVRPASPLPPTITGLSPNPADTGTPVTLTYTVTNPSTISGISIDWGDGTITHPGPTTTSDTHTYNTTGSLASEMFTINVTATNSAGHASATTAETVHDRSPMVTISNISPNLTTPGHLVTVSFSGTDADGTISSYRVDWGDSSPPDMPSASATSDTHTYTSAGSYTIAVTATDNSGSTGQNTGSVAVQAPLAPTITIGTITPNPADTGAMVTISFSVSSTASVTGIMVNWGDGSSTDYLSGSATSDAHTYSSTHNSKSQTFTITVTATNSAGPGFNTTMNTVNDRPPTITVSNVSPNPVDTGQTVTVTFSATDPDGTISSFTVDWGDGTIPDILPTSANSDTHLYNRAGSFTTTVTVTDNSGSSNKVSSLPTTITAPPAPVPPEPTILGISPTQFYSVIVIIATVIAAVSVLILRRKRVL
jgi:plastocyanin